MEPFFTKISLRQKSNQNEWRRANDVVFSLLHASGSVVLVGVSEKHGNIFLSIKV